MSINYQQEPDGTYTVTLTDGMTVPGFADELAAQVWIMEQSIMTATTTIGQNDAGEWSVVVSGLQYEFGLDEAAAREFYALVVDRLTAAQEWSQRSLDLLNQLEAVLKEASNLEQVYVFNDLFPLISVTPSGYQVPGMTFTQLQASEVGSLFQDVKAFLAENVQGEYNLNGSVRQAVILRRYTK